MRVFTRTSQNTDVSVGPILALIFGLFYLAAYALVWTIGALVLLSLWAYAKLR